ncbi:outer membrane lipoprotein-sorting protein [bacterium]|nr:outer membrane lipoprotein-sorting protein [bacterium]
MKRIGTMFVIGLVTVIIAQTAYAQLSGRDIMLKVDECGEVKTEYNKTKMILINKKGKTRVRDVVRYEKSYDGEKGIDSKLLIFFEYPSDIRGTGLLLWSYVDVGKEDDRWLYLPALKKIRRIAGESKNDYFMGTDFTYDDMGGRSIDDDTHKLLGKKILDGVECYKIESVPVDKDDQYSKKITWVIPDKWITAKMEFYNNNKKLQKVLTISDIRKVDKIWTPHLLFMDNLSKKHQTKIEIIEVRFNSEMNDQIFTTTTLQRGRVQ